VLHFDEYLKAPSDWPTVHAPRVMVDDSSWGAVCTGLVSAGVCTWIEESEVFHVGGVPLLNGMFGVTKDEWTAEGDEIFRLIMNLVPLNALCLPMSGDVDTLPSWGGMNPFFLQPSEHLLISSEDVKCFFYTMRVPLCWVKYLAFNKPVPDEVLPAHLRGRAIYIASRVLPMGFLNSVSLAQHVHRNLVSWSRVHEPTLVQEHNAPEQELRKDRPFTTGNPTWRVYLDNYDLLEWVEATQMAHLEGSVAPGVLALRQEYERWEVPRNQKKSVERSAKCEMQGATIDGKLGVAYPRESKLCRYFSLALNLASLELATQKQWQIVCGGLVYVSMFRRPMLSGLNAVWRHIESYNSGGSLRLRTPAECRLEILRFLGMFPLAIGVDPLRCDAGTLTWCHRPHLYWCDWEMISGEGYSLTREQQDQPVDLYLTGNQELSDVLRAGWIKVEPLTLFPTFTTARPRATPGRKPAGIQQCTLEELQRWTLDKHRFPPYQYRTVNALVNRSNEVRLPDVAERELLLGFPLNYTTGCFPKGEQKGEAYNDCRLTLLGNTWSVIVVACLLNQLLARLGLTPLRTPQMIIDQARPGHCSAVQGRLFRLPLNGPRAAKEDQSLELARRSEPNSVMPKRKLLEQHKASDRARERQKLGTLRELTVQPATRKRYQRATQAFFDFLHQEQLEISRKRDQFDIVVCEFLEHLWSTGVGRGQANDTVAGLQDLQPSAAFGENVILMSGGQDTTVQARGDVEVYGLSGLQTRALLAEQYQRERGQTSSAVNEALSSESCWLLRKLTPYQMQCLFDKVNVQTHEDGAEILSAGPKEHQDLHIVLQGQVSLVDPRGGEEIALVERMGVMGYTGVLYKEETFKAIARGSVQTLVLSSTLLQEMFGNALEETIIRSRILTSIRQQEELQHLRMDQLDGLASLYESIILKPGEVHERPAFRLGFILQGQAEATLINKEGLVIREPVILKDRGKVLIPEDADIEDKSPMLRLTLAAGETKNAQVAVWSGRTVAVFLEVVRKKKRLSASPDISPMSCSSEARQRSPSMRLAMVSDDKVGALRKVVVFRTLAQEQLENLADALEVESRKPGEIIFNQGEPGKEFYIIHTGLLEVSIGGRKVRTLGMGDYVGERALLLDENRSATVKVVEDCELWKMGADHFNKAVTIDSPIRDYMKARIDLQNTKVGLDSLQCMRVIGRGGFGVVKMVKSTTTNTRYALKCVSKKQAVEQKQQKALAHERNILAELDHPFIIKFVRSFNSARYVYFLTELVTGGELLDALDALGLLQAPQAQFYSASIILAIEFLHERRIAYLDLKGENCLIDQHGYLKIIDFGVAERITSGKIFAVKGTPLFMAPEVILGKGYNTAADLWSLGVCLFDFMVGSFPFGDDQASNAEIFKAVLKAPLKFPKWLGVHEKEAKELMKALLHRDPAKRLGAGQTGYDELKEHPFYSDFRWEHLLARQLAPPFTPKGETYAEDAEGGKDAGLGSLTVTEEDRQGDDDWIDPDPSWADEF
ncbi:unnamed protein product, partial [Cladocopium goreaui]